MMTAEQLRAPSPETSSLDFDRVWSMADELEMSTSGRLELIRRMVIEGIDCPREEVLPVLEAAKKEGFERRVSATAENLGIPGFEFEEPAIKGTEPWRIALYSYFMHPQGYLEPLDKKDTDSLFVALEALGKFKDGASLAQRFGQKRRAVHFLGLEEKYGETQVAAAESRVDLIKAQLKIYPQSRRCQRDLKEALSELGVKYYGARRLERAAVVMRELGDEKSALLIIEEAVETERRFGNPRDPIRAAFLAKEHGLIDSVDLYLEAGFPKSAASVALELGETEVGLEIAIRAKEFNQAINILGRQKWWKKPPERRTIQRKMRGMMWRLVNHLVDKGDFMEAGITTMHLGFEKKANLYYELGKLFPQHKRDFWWRFEWNSELL